MKKRNVIHAILIACILLTTILTGAQIKQSDYAYAAERTIQFTTVRNPGFAIWEDPNRVGYYAYDAPDLSGTTHRYWFYKDAYDSGQAFVRIGQEKPTTGPNGEKLNRSKLRLVEVRPYGHHAFESYQVGIEQSATRVLLNIAGISFTKTPYKDINNPQSKGTWHNEYEGGIYSENHHIPLEFVWEYTENDDTPPDHEASCPVNPENMVSPSDINSSSLVKIEKKTEYNEATGTSTTHTYYYYDYLDVSIEELSPTDLKAGYGFSFKVKTDYFNEYYNNWPGAQRVVAYFQKADSYLPLAVELEPVQSTSSWVNEWVFPKVFVEKFSGNLFYNTMDPNRDIEDELIDGGRKWYTPYKYPDGAYNFKVVAYNAGNNNLSDAAGDYVAVCGSPFDDYVIRSINPDNPFPGGVGYNWKGQESIISNLLGWFHRKE